MEEHMHGSEGMWHEVFEILTDPAHLIAEVVFSGLDVLIFGLLIPFVWSMARKRSRKEFEAIVDARVKAEHLAIDREHGITHVDHVHGTDPIPAEETR